MRFLLLAVAGVLALSCGRNERAAVREQPIGDEAALTRMLDGAFRGADPQGAVLLVGWTTGSPPSTELSDITERWASHGLVAVGVCLDLVQSPGDPDALKRVHEWERKHRLPFESLLFEGDPRFFVRRFDLSARDPFLILMNEQGRIVWRRQGPAGLDTLEVLLSRRLGEPSVA
jgi:hypothetical protein